MREHRLEWPGKGEMRPLPRRHDRHQTSVLLCEGSGGHKTTCSRVFISVDDREDLTDAQLLAAAQSDPEACACFYERYERSIVGYFMGRTGDPELTADLTSEM